MASIRKRGEKYEVQIRRLGLRHISKSFHRLDDARTWARHMEVRADCSDLPSDARVLKELTLGQLVIRYRDTISKQKRSWESENCVLTAFSRHPICSKRLVDLHPADFAQYRDERLRRIKPASLKRQLAPIHNLFEIARTHWDLPIRENPLDKLNFNAPDRSRERRLQPGEEAKIIKAAASCRNKMMVSIISFALETGMRRGEILAVRRDHVDLTRRALLIPEAKNGQARTIPLTKKATAILRRQKDAVDARLFTITANAVRLNWQRLRRRAGVSNLHFHDLRHEAISRFFEKGLTIPEVALISGHKDMRMLLRYAHPIRLEIIRKLGRAT
jgi:integrase